MSIRPREEKAAPKAFSLLASGGIVPPAPTAAQLSFDISDAIPKAPADVGAPLRTVAPSP